MTFIWNKYTASSLSLSPELGVPAKVKVRALDLLQAWMEGYFTVDFKNSRQLLDTLAAFLQSMVTTSVIIWNTAMPI